MNMLFVDPSVTDLGWSVYSINAVSASLVGSGHIRPKMEREESDAGFGNDLGYLIKTDSVALALVEIAAQFDCERALIEWPEVQGSAAGQAAANSGDTLKLMANAMGIRQELLCNGVEALVVKVRNWKGNKPKKATATRIERVWGLTFKNENEMDAVGIGSWYVRKVLHLVPSTE